MNKVFVTLMIGLIGLGFGLWACGDNVCPKGRKEVDGYCVKKSLAPYCHLKGTREVGESCTTVEDCFGCYLGCLEQICVELKTGGETCARDLECRSARCEDKTCMQESSS